MRVDLLILQATHAFYIVAAAKAWNKGYRGFSLFLSFMIIVSMLNHRQEQMNPFQKISSLEIFERGYVLGTALFAAIQFRQYIGWENWILLGLALVFYVRGDEDYYKREMNSYVGLHSVWHVLTGWVIIRIVDASPIHTSFF